jgi:hypothetical protein
MGRRGSRGNRRRRYGCSPDWKERQNSLAAAGRWEAWALRSEVRRKRDRLRAELAIALGGDSSAPPQPDTRAERVRGFLLSLLRFGPVDSFFLC